MLQSWLSKKILEKIVKAIANSSAEATQAWLAVATGKKDEDTTLDVRNLSFENQPLQQYLLKKAMPDFSARFFLNNDRTGLLKNQALTVWLLTALTFPSVRLPSRSGNVFFFGVQEN